MALPAMIPPDMPEKKAAVTFNYEESMFYRAIHADGVIGSVTPQGQIHAAFFNERPAIPSQTISEVDPKTGIIDKESTVSSDGGVVRELDVDVFMNLETAKALYTWLGARIQELEKLMPALEANRRK